MKEVRRLELYIKQKVFTLKDKYDVFNEMPEQ